MVVTIVTFFIVIYFEYYRVMTTGPDFSGKHSNNSVLKVSIGEE